MANSQAVPTPSFTSTLFGGAPYQTEAPSQGSINLYKDEACTEPFFNSATPLLLGECLNMPVEDSIAAVSINTLPNCPDYGNAFLIVSNLIDCKNSTAGPSADGGATDTCQAISTGTDIGSVQFACYGNGISSVRGYAAATSTYVAIQPTTTEDSGSNSGDGDTGDDDTTDSNDCNCCCVVM
jgi:hypothetical protein